jgi:glycosyltransferase involved in cell wall biosynthesis
MSEQNNRPLLTFAVVSCNQEQFVREAVGAAFAQTYSPLEVILSDDCSDDRSFEIMRQMAEAYRGPHQVVLNRNPVRKIMGGHLNRVVAISHGELIVIAAADDISLPQRTQVAYEAWEKSGRRATSLYSDVIQVDEDGREITQLFEFEQRKLCAKGQCVKQRVDPLASVQTLEPAVHGCAHVISPTLFTIFGNLPDQVVYEDKVLAFRSVLAGEVVYINEPLVKYRLHEANMHKYVRGGPGGTNLKSLERQENLLERGFRNSAIMYQSFLLDLEKAKQQGLLDGAKSEAAAEAADQKRRRFALMAEFLKGGLFSKCRILLQLQKTGLNKVDRGILVRRLIPRPLFLRIRLAAAARPLRRRAGCANATGNSQSRGTQPTAG